MDHLEEMCVDVMGNSEMYFKEMQLEDVDWVHLVQNRHQCFALVSTAMNIWVLIFFRTT
jgi:hypothetical protein